ncbi:MAG: hypothetical protein GEU83_08915 [Pseudonocardiaceae bacterium]|nr:hypothetical protein [Pseudonocardiaceae bacterium]
MDRPVVYLHVGGPKTGTTYLQAVLWHNRDALRRDGLLYPGRDSCSQFHAVQDLLRISFNGYDDPSVADAWDRLISELRSEPGSVLISHELLALAAAEHVEHAMQALSFAEIHVIYTVRDLARQVPSVWQEDLKNRHTLSFTEFTRGLRDDDPNPHTLVELFWRFQDPVGVLRRWGADIPPEQVHVVTVPPAGSAPGLLWERFAATIGVDPSRYETDVGHASNRSLGVVEANLLRRMNPVLAEELDWPAYQRWVTRFLTTSVFGARDRVIPITLPAAEYGWVLERSRHFVAELRDAGYHVMGELEEILPVTPAPDGVSRHPDDASDAEQLAAAADAMLGLIRCFEELTPARPAPRALPDEPMTLFRLGVQQLSNRHRSVMGLRQAYRWGKIGVTRMRDVARGGSARRGRVGGPGGLPS